MNKQCTYLSNDCTRRGKDIWDSYQVMEVIDKKKEAPTDCAMHIVCVCCQQLFMCIFGLFLFLVGVTLGNIMHWGFFPCWIYTCTRAIHLLEKIICKRIYLYNYTKSITFIFSDNLGVFDT